MGAYPTAIFAVLVGVSFVPAHAADDPSALLQQWGATAEACDVIRDQIRVIARARVRNPNVSDAELLRLVERADRLGTFAAQPRQVQLAIIHNMDDLYVGKYRDPVTGRIDPDADANQFFLGCTLAPSDK